MTRRGTWLPAGPVEEDGRPAVHLAGEAGELARHASTSNMVCLD